MFMIVVGLVFALLYFILRGVWAITYSLRKRPEDQTWPNVLAGLVSIVCACAAVFCIVFAATRWALS